MYNYVFIYYNISSKIKDGFTICSLEVYFYGNFYTSAPLDEWVNMSQIILIKSFNEIIVINKLGE